MGMAEYALDMIQARVLEQGTADNSTFPGYLAEDPGDGAPQVESNGIVSVTLQKMLMQVRQALARFAPFRIRTGSSEASSSLSLYYQKTTVKTTDCFELAVRGHA